MDSKKFKHFAEVDITLNIKSNRDYPQTANVMSNPYDLLDISNATTEYKWDLTGFVFTTEYYVTIQYRDINSASFSLFTQNLAATTLDGVVAALNILGIGFFYHYTTGGSTFVSTSNDNYVFGDLSILPDAGPTTTTTTTTTTAAPTTTTTTTTSTTTAAPTTTTTTTTSTTTAAPTTTTTTTTSTTTATPVFTYCLGYNASSDSVACADYFTYCI